MHTMPSPMTFSHGEVPPCILRDITNFPASHSTSLHLPIASSGSHFLQQFGASHPLGIGQSSLSQTAATVDDKTLLVVPHEQVDCVIVIAFFKEPIVGSLKYMMAEIRHLEN